MQAQSPDLRVPGRPQAPESRTARVVHFAARLLSTYGVTFFITAVLLLAAFLRTYRLLSLFPILVDEAIYLRWAEIIDHQGQWFVSLLDAKQPLSYWIYALLRKILPTLDPLIAPRMVSVAAGIASTYLLFLLAKHLSGVRAGISAAVLYAVMPWGGLFERLAYTDALVTLSGIGLALVSVVCFGHGMPTVRGALLTGVLLGVGFGFKSTAALFAPVPLWVMLLYGLRNRGRAWAAIVWCYSAALVFPLFTFLSVPDAPAFDVNNLLLHHTSFFSPLEVLAANPFVNLVQNITLVFEYTRCYMTLPLAIAALFSVVYLVARRRRAAYLMLLIMIPPVAFEVVALWFVHSRYLFPLVWPLVVLAALAISEFKLPAAALLTAVVAVPALAGSVRMLNNPAAQIHEVEVDEFLSSGPFSGYGIPDAVAYLKVQAARAPIVLLTDPRFGTPADAFHAYLNGSAGIRVYDAWWLQISADYPILPKKPTEVMKSQYERVAAGIVDFSALPRVYYVTDTNYNKPAEVTKREPNAHPEVRFPKRNSTHYIDLYRLR